MSESRVLRVLAIDDDSVSLTLLSTSLQECGYQVTTTTRATEALALLMESKNDYDIVITDIMMPEMDGFKLLQEIVRHEIGIPVIMISSDSSVKSVVKGVKSGAQDYLVKPVQLEDLRQIRDYVVKKAESDSPDDVFKIPSPEKSEEDETSDRYETESAQNGSNRRKYRKLSDRIVWTAELHKKFLDAVQKLQGDDTSKVIPKKILELMNEPNLRRENVASHLQKYRRSLMKQREVAVEESSSSAGAELSASITNPGHFTTNGSISDGLYDTNERTNNYSHFFDQSGGTPCVYPANQNAMLPQKFLHSTSQIVNQMQAEPLPSPMLENIIGAPVNFQKFDPRTRMIDDYTNNSWKLPYVMPLQQIPGPVSSLVNNYPSQYGIAPYPQSYNTLTSNYQMPRGVPNQMFQVDPRLQQAQRSLTGCHDVQNYRASGSEFAGNEQSKFQELLQENPNREIIDCPLLSDELNALIGSDNTPTL